MFISIKKEPHVRDLSFEISHTGGYCAEAIAPLFHRD